MLGIPLLYFKGMRLLMFQLSGFYYTQLYAWAVVQVLRARILDKKVSVNGGTIA